MTASSGLRRRSTAVKDFRRQELKRHANQIRKDLIRSAKSATGGDRRLSGLGNKPLISVRVRTVDGNRTTSVTIVPSPKAAAGPWRWIEDGTKPGRRAGRKSTRNGRTRRASTVEGVGSYFHPGTRGTQGVKAWSTPLVTRIPKVRAELRASFKQTMK